MLLWSSRTGKVARQRGAGSLRNARATQIGDAHWTASFGSNATSSLQMTYLEGGLPDLLLRIYNNSLYGRHSIGYGNHG